MVPDPHRSAPRPTRRRFLALAGAATLSGCTALGDSRDDGGRSSVDLDATAVETVLSGSVPSVTEPLPVDVAKSHVSASRTAARAALDAVPLPLSPAELPDETLRAVVHRDAEDARSLLAAAGDAATDRDRLDLLRRARGQAQRVATTWAFVSDEVTRDDVRERGRTLRDDATAFREGQTYVGSGPVRALLTHAVVESWTESAVDAAIPGWNDYERPSSDAPTADDAEELQLPDARAVGKRAGQIETGRARLDDARHVQRRLADSIADEASMRPTLVDARESLTSTLASRRAEIPGPEADGAAELVGTDVAIGEPARNALRELRDDVAHYAALGPSGNPASDVLARCEGLANAEAFLSLRDRIAGGERFPVESVDDVRERRETAVAAIETALAESSHRGLAAHVLEYPAAEIANSEEVFDYHDRATIEVNDLAPEIRYYVQFAALARAVPGACAETVAALGGEGR